LIIKIGEGGISKMTHIVKVFNLVQDNGHVDYKGLDLNKIVGGTQLYPNYDNVAYFMYDGDVTETTGIQIVTQATYDEHKNRIANEPKPLSDSDRIKMLEDSIDFLMMGGM